MREWKEKGMKNEKDEGKMKEREEEIVCNG